MASSPIEHLSRQLNGLAPYAELADGGFCYAAFVIGVFSHAIVGGGLFRPVFFAV